MPSCSLIPKVEWWRGSSQEQGTDRGTCRSEQFPCLLLSKAALPVPQCYKPWVKDCDIPSFYQLTHDLKRQVAQLQLSKESGTLAEEQKTQREPGKANCSCKACYVSPKRNTHEIQLPGHKVTPGNEDEGSYLPSLMTMKKDDNRAGRSNPTIHKLQEHQIYMRKCTQVRFDLSGNSPERESLQNILWKISMLVNRCPRASWAFRGSSPSQGKNGTAIPWQHVFSL